MPKRRKVLIGLGGISALSGCSELEQLIPPSEEEVKEEAESPGWEELFRNISDWEGEPVRYSDVRVADFNDEGGEFTLIISHPDQEMLGDKYLFCRWDGDPFQDGDNINIWGTVQGLHTYTSLTGERTVPEIELVDIELVD